jgi:PleD family two-component response regulator
MTATRALSLLVVDDEPLLRTLLSRGLEPHGYAVTEAEHGQAAIDACAEQLFDLVLMDVSMPVMDGFTACRNLRNRFPDLPIIMLTGYDDMEAINAAFGSGATDFMSKPVSLPLLTQRIRYAMRATSRDQELLRAYHDQNTACRLARIGFWRLETRSGTLTWSERAHELVGLPSPPGSIGDVFRLLTEDQVRQLKAQFRAALSSRSALNTEIVFGACEDRRCVRLMADNALDPDIISGAFQDVTEQRGIESQLVYMAEHDYLTGLPKRSLFLSQLQAQLDLASGGQVWLVGLLDISRLQRINDAFGSEAGDQILVMLAKRLSALLPQPGLLARLEADRFVFALPSPVPRAECEHWLRLLLTPL